MLLTKEVEVDVSGSCYNYYSNLGYNIPKRIDNRGRFTVPRNTIIKVKINDLPLTSNKRVRYKCDNCGKIIDIDYSDYTAKNFGLGDFCKQCSCVYVSGERCHMWNHNLTDEERYAQNISLRATKDKKKFVKKVLLRDNYKCLKCGNNTRDLQVHHLDGWHWCKERRYDVSNGATLCTKCHQNFHMMYGNKNNTKEQFFEWSKLSLEDIKDYNGNIQTCKKIIDPVNNIIIDNCMEYCNQHQLSFSNVYKCCNRNIDNKGCACNGIPYMWYDDYRNKSQEDLVKLYSNISHKLIVCVQLNTCFYSLSDIAIYLNINDTKTLRKNIKLHKPYKKYDWEYLYFYDGDKTKLKYITHEECVKHKNEIMKGGK